MHEPWTSTAFMSAGALMLAVTALAAVGAVVGGDPPGWFFPLVFVLFGATVLAAVAGLRGLYPALRGAAPRLAGTGMVLAGLAAVSALSWIVVGLTGRPPWEIGDAYYGVVLGGLVALLAGCLVLGITVLRTSTVPQPVGRLLVVGGLTFLIPVLGEGLLARPPDWLPFILLGVWFVVFFGSGRALRRDAPLAAPAGEAHPARR